MSGHVNEMITPPDQPRAWPEGWGDTSILSSSELRTIFGSFLTGVTVIATRDTSGQALAFTANSFTSVSIEPPLVLFCLRKAAFSYEAFISSKSFAVSVLCDSQKDISLLFSTPAKKSEAIFQKALPQDWPPIIAGCLSAIVCRRRNVFDGGDHSIVLGEVLHARSEHGDPLGYFRGAFTQIGLPSSSLAMLRGDAQ